MIPKGGRVTTATRTFWTSPMASQKRPIAKRTMPAISREEPNLGLAPPCRGSDTAGELRTTTGRADRWMSETRSQKGNLESDRLRTNDKDPEQLTNPETCKLEKVGAHLVKSGIACSRAKVGGSADVEEKRERRRISPRVNPRER